MKRWLQEADALGVSQFMGGAVEQGPEALVLNAEIQKQGEALLKEIGSRVKEGAFFGSWHFGVVIAIAATIAGGCADSLVVRAQGTGSSAFDVEGNVINPRDNSNMRRRVGIFVTLLAETISYMIALCFASVSVAVPCLSLHQVARMCCDVIVVGKPTGGAAMQYGIGLVLIGLVLSVLFGVHESINGANLGWQTLVSEFEQMPFRMWTLSCLALLIGLLVVVVLCPLRDELLFPDVRDGAPEFSSPGVSVAGSPQYYQQVPSNRRLLLERWLYLCGGTECLKKVCPVSRIPVAPATRKHCMALSIGVLSGTLLVFAQNVILSLNHDPSSFSLLPSASKITSALIWTGASLYLIILGAMVHSVLYEFEPAAVLPQMTGFTILFACCSDYILQMRGDVSLFRFCIYFGGLVAIIVGLTLVSRADVRRQMEDLQSIAQEMARVTALFGADPSDVRDIRHTEFGLGAMSTQAVSSPEVSRETTSLRKDMERETAWVALSAAGSYKPGPGVHISAHISAESDEVMKTIMREVGMNDGSPKEAWNFGSGEEDR